MGIAPRSELRRARFLGEPSGHSIADKAARPIGSVTKEVPPRLRDAPLRYASAGRK